jgi:hypothetical protein
MGFNAPVHKLGAHLLSDKTGSSCHESFIDAIQYQLFFDVVQQK